MIDLYMDKSAGVPFVSSLGVAGATAGLKGVNEFGRELKALTGIGSVADLSAKIKGWTPTGRALNRARQARAMSDPAVANLVNLSQNLEAVGMDAATATNLARTYHTSLQAQQAAHQLQQSKTILGRMGQSSLGQLATPVMAMGLVTGGALAAQKVFDVLGAAGINVDPSARLAASYGLKRVLEAKPELANEPAERVRRCYEMVFSHSPELAKNPIAMATEIERLLHMGGIDHAYVKELSDTQKSVREPNKWPLDLYSMGSNLIYRR